MNEIVMPKLSDTMTEGRLVSWKKRVGEAVRRGDVLAEVETDKANMELEAFTSGVLLEIRVEAGELAQVGTVIGVIGKAGEKAKPPEPAAASGEGGGKGAEQGEPVAAVPKKEASAGEAGPAAAKQAEAAKAAQPAEEKSAPPAEEKSAESTEIKPAPPAEGAEAAAPKPSKAEAAPPSTKEEQAPAVPPAEAEGEKQAPAAPVEPAAPEAAAGEGGKQAPAASVEPAAPEAAAGEGQAPSEASAAPTGAAPAEAAPAGGEVPPQAESRERAAPVVRRRARELGIDLSQVKGSGPDGRILLQDLEQGEEISRQPAAPPAPPAQAAVQEGVRPLSRLRSAIARTVSESWSSIPHFSVTMDIFMDQAEAVRHQLKLGAMAVTLNDVVVRAVTLALSKFPLLNASFVPEGVRFHSDINIGIAVGLPEGVVVPVIRGCQRLSLLEISKSAKELVERAHNGSLSEQDMSGGTFSVSNLGMYGISQFNAIIYPHQAGVLAVGAVLDSAVLYAGAPAPAKIMKVTLTADHRLADGAYAAEFLVELKGILENPFRLLI